MTVTAKVLIASQDAPNAQTSLYISTNVTTLVDKLVCTNYSGGAQTISINLVTSAGAAGNTNLVVKLKSLQAAETYTFPEIVGFALGPGDFISVIASAATTINIRASGRVIS